MTFKLYEKTQHIDASGDGLVYHFGAVGSQSVTYVTAVARLSTYPVLASPIGILYRQPVRVNSTGFESFDVDVEYQPRKNEAGEFDWDFDTTGGTIQLFASKETRAKYPTASAPSYDQAIDVQGDEVKGVPVVIPAMKINVSYRHPPGTITLAYAKHLRNLTGLVNSAPFLTFAAGEVLFLGASGRDGSANEASVQYQFGVSENASNITVGAVTIAAKLGWDAVWIKFKDDEKTVSGDTYGVKIPQFAYVERVYDTVNLASELGFG